MNRHLPAYTAALALAACSPHMVADTGQPETPAASEAAVPKQEKTYPVDKAKIARNMAAWDKLMASPGQQPPNTGEYRKRAEKNRLFAKYAVPLKQIRPVSDKNIQSIEIIYAGMRIAPTHNHEIRFFGVLNLSGYLMYGPDSNRLLEEKAFMKGDTANFRLPPERFAEFVGMLNNLRVWRYPNPDSTESKQHRLMIAVTYQDGRVWALGANYRFRYENHLSAIVDKNLSPENEDYVFLYVSLRDIVLLMQYLDDRVPVFLERRNVGGLHDELTLWRKIRDGQQQ